MNLQITALKNYFKLIYIAQNIIKIIIEKIIIDKIHKGLKIVYKINFIKKRIDIVLAMATYKSKDAIILKRINQILIFNQLRKYMYKLKYDC